MTPNIPLIAWDPDGDPTRPGILAEVYNLIPTRRGFVSDLAGGDFAGVTLPSKCYGGQMITLGTGDHVVLLATRDDLWFLGAGGSLLNRNRASGGPYNSVTFPGVGWRFAQFGEQTLAIQRDNPLQASAGIAGTNFANVSGGPAARTICVASNFVMVGNTEDPFSAGPAGFRHSDGWWCSALGNHASWTPDLATQCDRGRLRETPGPIVRMFAYGPDVLAFKERSLVRGRYVNRPADGIIWQWTTISTEVGIVGHDAVCQVGGIVYFLSHDGVYAFNGSALRRIDSFPRLWFARRMNNPGSDVNVLAITQAVYDPVRRVIRWHFMENEAAQLADAWTGGCMTYHVETDRWGYSGMHPSEWALNVPFSTVGYVDGGAYTPTAQQPVLSYTTRGAAAYINASDRKLKTYSSSAVQSILTTGDIGDDDLYSVTVRARLRFLRAPGSGAAQHYYRSNLGDDLTLGETSQRVDGKYDFSHSARWHRVQVQMNGPIEVNGMRVKAEAAGNR